MFGKNGHRKYADHSQISRWVTLLVISSPQYHSKLSLGLSFTNIRFAFSQVPLKETATNQFSIFEVRALCVRHSFI